MSRGERFVSSVSPRTPTADMVLAVQTVYPKSVRRRSSARGSGRPYPEEVERELTAWERERRAARRR